jgi:hypothetical protein
LHDIYIDEKRELWFICLNKRKKDPACWVLFLWALAPSGSEGFFVGKDFSPTVKSLLYPADNKIAKFGGF